MLRCSLHAPFQHQGGNAFLLGSIFMPSDCCENVAMVTTYVRSHELCKSAYAAYHLQGMVHASLKIVEEQILAEALWHIFPAMCITHTHTLF